MTRSSKPDDGLGRASPTSHEGVGLSSPTSPGRRARAVVIGASGYTGAELIEIVLRHPSAQLVGLFGSGRTAEAQTLDSLWPRFRGQCDLKVLPLSGGSATSTPSSPSSGSTAASMDAVLSLEPDAVFLATPHEASLDLAAALIHRVRVVVDLSAAFRLSSPDAYPKHYAFAHHHPELLPSAIYGLPELNRARLASASLIAAPGCYPTSAILPLWPLVQAGAIRPGFTPIIDSTSGVSGAGRTPNQRSLFCEVSQSPYAALRHRHSPEIAEHAGTPVHFVPHLGPYDRGILTTIHVELAHGWTESRVRDELARRYARERFIRLLPAGQWPTVAAVRNTNFCDIALIESDPAGHLVLCSAIDNLVKGASGQAVQAMNVALGLDESAGLAPSPACGGGVNEALPS